MLSLAAEPWASTPAQAQEYVGSEVLRWAGVIKAANIKPD
jgi:hypothetical protein